jgi:hypothetical protein
MSDDQVNAAENDEQVIFEQRWNSLTNDFGKACDEHGVELAFAIAIHPREKMPIIFVKGHQYDVAVLISDILHNLKSDLFKRFQS